jgi:hypothetical protein
MFQHKSQILPFIRADDFKEYTNDPIEIGHNDRLESSRWYIYIWISYFG